MLPHEWFVVASKHIFETHLKSYVPQNLPSSYKLEIQKFDVI